MFEKLVDRIKFAETLKNEIEKKFTDENYQVFIFGSFLTEDYIPNKSDIDIGIYSEKIDTAIDIKYFVKSILQSNNLENDIIIMQLTDDDYMNIPIFMYGQPLFSYIRDEFIDNLKSLIEKWGTNPFEKIYER